MLCLDCLSSLPQTRFHFYPNNPIEKIFWGRIPVTHATAQYYYTRNSLIQHLMHQFKYKGHKELGFYLGRLMGTALSNSNRFSYVDLLIPLPLFSGKERKRGFNQAAILCEGMAAEMHKQVGNEIIRRASSNESQTKKGRVERWQNMEGRFELADPSRIENKHVLLVDDVITTGATLEACGKELLKANGARVSIASLSFSSGN